MLPCKVIWDYTYYWSVLAQLFCQDRLTDLGSMGHLRDELAACQKLNVAVQDFLRAWGTVSARRNLPVMLDQASVPWFVELNRSLHDAALDDEAFRARIRQAALTLQQLAAELLQRGSREHPQLDGSALRALLPAAALQPRDEQLLFRARTRCSRNWRPRRPAAPAWPGRPRSSGLERRQAAPAAPQQHAAAAARTRPSAACASSSAAGCRGRSGSARRRLRRR